MLRRLSQASGIAIVACTGFHLRKYYPADEPLWSLPAEQAAEHFIRELTMGVEEAPGDAGEPIRAGFIKIACEATVAGSPPALLQAAAHAAQETGAALEVHTEKGASAEHIVWFFYNAGVPLRQLVICHIDKRPDFGLHRELATAGVLLEYDTFYRPKYEPERGVWPLLERMIGADLGGSVALASDMAECELWETMGGGPGMAALLTIIRPRLLEMGVPAGVLAGLLGENIARRLVPHQPTV
jgi:phosphotriesterase-related protein